LICYLEAGKYAEAGDNCDLFSCVECGLCSYVCVSRIPIFQFITLAKYELARVRNLEAPNA
jgi:electron transport complex protein RnfC